MAIRDGLKNNVHSTTEFLERFFSNLLMGTKYELKNRYMHVDYVEDDYAESKSAKIEASKCKIALWNALWKN